MARGHRPLCECTTATHPDPRPSTIHGVVSPQRPVNISFTFVSIVCTTGQQVCSRAAQMLLVRSKEHDQRLRFSAHHQARCARFGHVTFLRSICMCMSILAWVFTPSLRVPTRRAYSIASTQEHLFVFVAPRLPSLYTMHIWMFTFPALPRDSALSDPTHLLTLFRRLARQHILLCAGPPQPSGIARA